ncbi:MAG: GNAT family N-acetyltransferase [Oscillospiraceae bacterium]|jgi:GNAT superfamily N-acetyltransferase|nr:GNAT family N-acetyltransferase [Oscillospiraceae bacterium]
MKIREAEHADLRGLLELYTHLNVNPMPAEIGEDIYALWREMLADKNHHIVLADEDGVIVSSCIAIIVPNLTHVQRPHAVVENVVTHAEHRGRGYATAVMDYARELARNENCYKIMLMTGSKQKNVLDFYVNCGYNTKDKTGFVQWL